MNWWTGGCSLGLVMVLGGCPGEVGSEEDDGSMPTTLSTTSPTADSGTSGPGSSGTGPGTTSGTTTSATSTTGSTGDSATTDVDPPFFDLGSLPDSPEFDMGCRKVDFLFAIDNSGSMSAQQAQLLASFPGFIQAIQNSLDETVDSYHVGVITSDAYSANAPGCNTLGALVSQTQAGGDCTPFAEGNRFATEMDDLEDKFGCMAEVGAFGSGVEQPVTGSIAALSSMMGPGECNEGFLRDDAILVLVVITDDPPAGTLDDANLMTDTSTWYDSIIAAKNGDPEALVVIGFVPWTDVTCVVFGIESPNLIDFVTSFGDQGVIASICEPDFGPAFANTVETIVTTCENFEPPA